MSSAPVADPPVDRPYRLDTVEVLRTLAVDPDQGLSSHEVERRRAADGPNELPDEERTPAWRRYLAQFRDLLIGILVAAAAVSFLVSGELKTPIVVLAVVVLNATIGFIQENKAEAALDALRSMLVTTCRVRRDGSLREIPASDLVVGDIVLVEAGDRIPADGRLVAAAALEVEESALTGEGVPVVKQTGVVARDGLARQDVAVADRSNMVHMNSTVTRGRGDLVVTAVGAATEIGRVAGMLTGAQGTTTPLQRQLDTLAKSLAYLAGVIVALVVAIGMARGIALSDLFLTGVALAVASIPEGLPAVTAVTLAIGVSTMARQNAIVKRLANVETLGCTSVICTDKTGTLTLNQMTARAVVVGGRIHPVTGEGYSPEGRVGDDDQGRPFAGVTEESDLVEAMALCSDAEIRDEGDGAWQVVGDPTDGALVVLAMKAGIDIAGIRERHPRHDEVPFDSAHKFMATAHSVPGENGEPVVRLYVKGAPDALVARSSHVLGVHGGDVPLDEARASLESANAEMAAKGMRVLAVAQRDLTADIWARVQGGGDLMDVVEGLTLLALVGIVDPPRVEAAAAIDEAQRAGIRFAMITGDHAATAMAIGEQLGLGAGGEIDAMTGAELDELDDDELSERIGSVSVFARVTPEHKLRLVTALQRRGEVVAMTGDGVNDAPALKQADIGVAMGITGTEVSKEAADMVLADDNVATIVVAIRQGRGIYDNIVSFVRFQLSTTLGFAILFLAAAITGVASGKPFTAIAILWVNVIMDGPPAMALGLDPADADVMARRPRPRDERIVTRHRWVTILIAAAVMAAGTMAVLVMAPGDDPMAGVATVAGTMAFNTFVLFQFFNIMNVRSDRMSVFSTSTFSNRWLWGALAGVLALQVGATHLGWLQGLFDTTSLTLGQWAVCVAVASTVLWVEELRKLVGRHRHGAQSAQ
ncbi:MAG: cation-translocating P-type ATPase [Acidimicrobiales bacterium]